MKCCCRSNWDTRIHRTASLLLTSLARLCCTQRFILCFCTRDEEIHLFEGLKWITGSLYKGEFHCSRKGKKLFLTVSQHLMTSGEKWAFEKQHPSAEQVPCSSRDNFRTLVTPLTCYVLLTPFALGAQHLAKLVLYSEEQDGARAYSLHISNSPP